MQVSPAINRTGASSPSFVAAHFGIAMGDGHWQHALNRSTRRSTAQETKMSYPAQAPNHF